MRINIYIVIIAFFSFLNSFSQTSNFKSYVIDRQNSKPISEAVIDVLDLGIKVKSDSEGQFNIKADTTAGLFVGTVSHKNFLTKGFLIEFIDGKPKAIENITLEATYKEGFRRKRINQKRDIELARLRKKKLKELRQREKILAKERRALIERELYAKNNDEDTPTSTHTPTTTQTKQNTNPKKYNNQGVLFSDIQYKYARLLGVAVENLTNVDLYNYIDRWYKTTFKVDNNGLLFLEGLFINGYDLSIESTINELYNSELTNKFNSKEYLREGDLLFFKQPNGAKPQITQVAMFLHNNKFVYKSIDHQEIKIGDLTDNYWSTNFVTAGRRIFNK